MSKGWHNDPYEHSLASRGIKSRSDKQTLISRSYKAANLYEGFVVYGDDREIFMTPEGFANDLSEYSGIPLGQIKSMMFIDDPAILELAKEKYGDDIKGYTTKAGESKPYTDYYISPVGEPAEYDGSIGRIIADNNGVLTFQFEEDYDENARYRTGIDKHDEKYPEKITYHEGDTIDVSFTSHRLNHAIHGVAFNDEMFLAYTEEGEQNV